MKKVLIISYYWPPSAGAGIHRWLKFSKYLRDFGWEPVIYTPDNPEAPSTDHSLEKDVPQDTTVLKTKIWEPYRFYKLFTGRKMLEKVQTGFLSEHKKPGLSEQISAWIRGNFFIPDARKFWINPSVKYLINWLSRNKVDAMVSTGPPHSMHLVALALKQKTGIPWLADFRDPWTQIDFYNKLLLSKWADSRHKLLEKQVLMAADKVVTVSQNWANDLKKIYFRDYQVITNGFDPDDFLNLPEFQYDFLRITHLGSLNADRNPTKLWEVLGELIKENDLFSQFLRIMLIGQTDISVTESINKNGIRGFVEKTGFLPHDQALHLAAQSAILLLPVNNTPNLMGIIPGKLFEYLALKRPILVIGPEKGDTARIIESTHSGFVAGFSDKQKLKCLLIEFAQQFYNRSLQLTPTTLENYTRKHLTGKMSELLNQITLKP